MKIKPAGWVIIVALLGGTLYFSLKQWAPGLISKMFPEKEVAESVVPKSANLPTVADPSLAGRQAGSSRDLSTSSFPQLSSQDLAPGCANLSEVRFLHYAWNAHTGLMYANGGRQAARGSLMCKHGVNLKLERQDWNDKLIEALVACATELQQGASECSRGAHFVTIMGDGGAAFIKALNDQLKRLGPAYLAKVIGSAGYSVGEDKFMGPPSCRDNPAACRGLLIAGVLRDGDWNIGVDWAGRNDICNNPDETTYDPDCLNWRNTPGYIEAAQDYVAGVCEDRPVVSRGKKTGEKKSVCVGGVVTWTPGDVIVAEQKGGLASLLSTRENRWQMPNTIIGIGKWMETHRSQVEGMLAATFEGGEAVRTDDAALRRAAVISDLAYNEKNTGPAYWYRYYHGDTVTDKQGLRVEVGGSIANTLSDNLKLYGLEAGGANLFAATYTEFGRIVVQQYPNLVPSFYPVGEILDTSYVQAVAGRTTSRVAAAQPTFEAARPVTHVVGKRSWTINFRFGNADFTPDARAVLEDLHRSALVAGGTAIEIHGHTDGDGGAEANLELSRDRALAVKNWLQTKSAVHFGDGRVRSFGHGETEPVADNSSPAGKARNRRVEIVFGTTD